MLKERGQPKREKSLEEKRSYNKCSPKEGAEDMRRKGILISDEETYGGTTPSVSHRAGPRIPDDGRQMMMIHFLPDY